MATSYSRGHQIYYDFNSKVWRYVDSGEVDNDQRPCKLCGKMPTKEGYDPCIGHIEGAISACCGHGVTEPFVMYKE